MKYVIDIDNTICETNGTDYYNAKPKKNIIEKINKLYEKNHYIIIETARGSETGINWSELTEKQLKEWGLKYHLLSFNKYSADYYIDDKAINIKDWL